MAVAYVARETVAMKVMIPDQGFETFVAKVQNVKTRKGKDYFISRITIPKEAINNIELDSEDYVFIKAKKAEWFHMLNWDDMESTWNMLPLETKIEVIKDGLVKNSHYIQTDNLLNPPELPGATNPGMGTRLVENTLLDTTGNTR